MHDCCVPDVRCFHGFFPNRANNAWKRRLHADSSSVRCMHGSTVRDYQDGGGVGVRAHWGLKTLLLRSSSTHLSLFLVYSVKSELHTFDPAWTNIVQRQQLSSQMNFLWSYPWNAQRRPPKRQDSSSTCLSVDCNRFDPDQDVNQMRTSNVMKIAYSTDILASSTTSSSSSRSARARLRGFPPSRVCTESVNYVNPLFGSIDSSSQSKFIKLISKQLRYSHFFSWTV